VRKSTNDGMAGHFGPLDIGDRIETIKVHYTKAFDLVPQGRILTKFANSGVDSMIVVWIREFLLGRMHRCSVEGQ